MSEPAGGMHTQIRTPTHMSPETAAKAHKVSRWTIMRAIKSGDLRAYRDNKNHWKITPDSFFAWVNGEGPSSVHSAQETTGALRERLSAETVRADIAEALLSATEADRDHWREMAKKLVEKPRRSWWSWR